MDPAVQAEIRAAAERSVLDPSWSDTPVSVGALNTFANAFYRCGDYDGARALVRRIGSRRSEAGWMYTPLAGQVFAKLSPRP
jgi:hypothetical protein